MWYECADETTLVWHPRHALARGRDPASRTERLVAGEPLGSASRDPRPRLLDRLLVATTTGRLEVREDPWDATSIAWSIDLGDDRPAAAEQPSLARRWVE
jgi:hypothetical protein